MFKSTQDVNRKGETTMKRNRRIIKAILAIILSLSMLLPTTLAMANNAPAVYAEDMNIHEPLSTPELLTALEDPDFTAFAAAFSYLEGCVDEIPTLAEAVINGLTSSSRQGRLSEPPINDWMKVQLDALYTLYEDGIRDADQWIEDTYIDLSAYPEYLWYVKDFETGNEYNYAIIDDVMQRIEVNFTPNPPEIAALRQTLLAPHATIHHNEMVSNANRSLDAMPSADLLQPRASVLRPVTNLTQQPFRSVGVLRGSRITGPGPPPAVTDQGTAFLVCNRLALTAAHVLILPYGGGSLSNLILHTARNANGSGGISRSVSSAWIPQQWRQNPSYANAQFDKAILSFARDAFGTNNHLRTRTSQLRTIPTQDIIRITGYTRTSSSAPRVTMFEATGHFTSTRGNYEIFSTLTANSGMSGGPVMLASNHNVFGIISGNSSGLGQRTVRISIAFENEMYRIRLRS